METQIEQLKRAHNYNKENKEILITHSNKNGKYSNQYRIEWFDFDDTWLLVRLAGLKKCKRLKKTNIKSEVVLLNYDQRKVLENA